MRPFTLNYAFRRGATTVVTPYRFDASRQLNVLPDGRPAVSDPELLLAAGTGAGSWLFSHPFLSSYFAYADLPVIGEVPVASALAFDLGVLLLVVGATALMLVALAHQSIRSHRAPGLRAPAMAATEER